MTKVVWREYFMPPTVRKLEEMGTLPRYEAEVSKWEGIRGDDVATRLAELAHQEDSEWFKNGGKLVILEPEEFAGTYEVNVDWEPSFSANPVEEKPA